MGAFTRTPKNMITTLGASMTSAGRIFTPIAYSPIGKGQQTMNPPPVLTTSGTPNNVYNKQRQFQPSIKSPKRLFSQAIAGNQVPTPAAIMIPEDNNNA